MRNRNVCICMMVVTFLMGWTGLACSASTEVAKLTADDGVSYDRFGHSVSIDGEYVIVGALTGDVGSPANTGSAYIFKRGGSGWTQQDELIASDAGMGDNFGASVSIDGEYVVVGAYNSDSGVGSAYVFKRDGSIWTQQTKLTASDGADDDWFGKSVSINGEYVIVGALKDDDKGEDSGSAYIFKRNGSTWTQQAKLIASDGGVYEEFGCSVSIDGDYVIVGAYLDNENGANSGSAYIFKRGGSGWTQQAKLISSDGEGSDYFGYSVSIDSEYVVAGAYNDNDDNNGNNSGSAYIFTGSGTNWTQQARLTASDGASNDYFGYSVSMDGEYVVAGAWRADSYFGSAYIFKRDGTNWSEQDKLTASDADNDFFGYSVCISGGNTIVGAYEDDDNGINSGSAYMFGGLAVCPSADLTGDCFVDLEDFAVLADQWLTGTR